MSWTIESLTPGSALMKLAKGRGMSEEALLTTGATALAALEGVWGPCLAGSATSRSALAFPTSEGAEAPVLPGCSSVLCFLRTDRLTVGLFPRGIREGACKKEFSLYIPRETEERQIKVIYRTFLACWATRSRLPSSRLCSAVAATCSRVASPVLKIGTSPPSQG
ncbi:hypothetical protein Cgig2_029001 [Carnegiea gigantea]|uniref:Uncharacterized protein n=1 Tax=Carnegiea gigantea TaxID=171969 RepID=A0A9Q1GG78_9CARY|nr:hypothetical protein Cgig2_029001 [Carnegiea gigantea]